MINPSRPKKPNQTKPNQSNPIQSKPNQNEFIRFILLNKRHIQVSETIGGARYCQHRQHRYRLRSQRRFKWSQGDRQDRRKGNSGGRGQGQLLSERSYHSWSELSFLSIAIYRFAFQMNNSDPSSPSFFFRTLRLISGICSDMPKNSACFSLLEARKTLLYISRSSCRTYSAPAETGHSSGRFCSMPENSRRSFCRVWTRTTHLSLPQSSS